MILEHLICTHVVKHCGRMFDISPVNSNKSELRSNRAHVVDETDLNAASSQHGSSNIVLSGNEALSRYERCDIVILHDSKSGEL